jgi:hypothetical protein
MNMNQSLSYNDNEEQYFEEDDLVKDLQHADDQIGQVNQLSKILNGITCDINTSEEKSMFAELEECAEKTAYSLYRAIKLIENSTKDSLIILERGDWETINEETIGNQLATVRFEEVKEHLKALDFASRRCEDSLKERSKLPHAPQPHAKAQVSGWNPIFTAISVACVVVLGGVGAAAIRPHLLLEQEEKKVDDVLVMERNIQELEKLRRKLRMIKIRIEDVEVSSYMLTRTSHGQIKILRCRMMSLRKECESLLKALIRDE